jgi:cold shock protein
MNTGVVKFFNRKKGFGFIIADETAEEFFFHATGLTDSRYINSGDKVSFEQTEGRSGKAATNIRKTGEAPKADDAENK